MILLAFVFGAIRKVGLIFWLFLISSKFPRIGALARAFYSEVWLIFLACLLDNIGFFILVPWGGCSALITQRVSSACGKAVDDPHISLGRCSLRCVSLPTVDK